MASSEKKRAREQNAAARRDRVAQKRTEKRTASEGANDSPPYTHDDLPPVEEAEPVAEPAE